MSTPGEGTRNRNLELLRARNPAVAARCERVAALGRHVSLESARSGHPVPTVRREERLRWLHSRVDPLREAERLVSLLPETSGFLVVFGLGGGYHVRQLLARPGTRRVLVVETAAEWLVPALGVPDMEEVFSDPRVAFHLSEDGAELEARVAEHYLPLFHREASFLPLRGRVDLDAEAFRKLQERAGAGVEACLADFATQRAFGRRWMHNILVNLLRLSGRRPENPGASHGTAAVVTAAGPSLETLFSREDPAGGRTALDSGAPLVATDTSLPMLLQRGMAPDLLVSLDSQGASYHHLLRGIPAKTLVVAPLSAAPVVMRLASRICASIGGHPLEHYLAEGWRGLPRLYTRGGSVTHAALDLARRQLETTEIFLYGADFAYPGGAAYARDSYMHRHFRLREQRLRPAEGGFADFVYRRARLDSEHDREAGGSSDGEIRYRSALLEGYRQRFEGLVKELGVSLSRAPARASGRRGESPLQPDRRPAPENAPEARRGGGLPDPRPTLARYLEGLEALGTPDEEAATLDPAQLPPEERRLWSTLTPLAASLSATPEGRATPAEAPGRLLVRAREESLQLLRSLLGT